MEVVEHFESWKVFRSDTLWGGDWPIKRSAFILLIYRYLVLVLVWQYCMAHLNYATASGPAMCQNNSFAIILTVLLQNRPYQYTVVPG